MIHRHYLAAFVFFTLTTLVSAQGFQQRPPLTPAQTLLAPATLAAIDRQAAGGATRAIDGTDAAAGTILLTCAVDRCDTALAAASKLAGLVAARTIDPPARTIRVASDTNGVEAGRVGAAIHVVPGEPAPMRVVRGLWSTAGIGDEVVEIFARHGGRVVDARPFEDVGQLHLDYAGVPTTAIVGGDPGQAASVAAAAVYALATLPNLGSEALLSHLTVGAHARLAEDARRAVAMMGTQQRASAEVLILLGQAIEREQRRIGSFAAFMPAPVDPVLQERLADMERGVTSLWSSLGITGSPFVPPAERIRGRGGDDQRVPSRASAGAPPSVALPGGLGWLPHPEDAAREMTNFVDGRRTISDIRDAVSAEFGPVQLTAVVEYLNRLQQAGWIAIK